ncbi:ubiquitin ligase (cullin) of SCF, partial [Linderina pennispora]
MEVYEKYFQEPFLAMSTEYYEAESARLLQEGTIRDYMVKIAQRLQEEDDRALMYLHPDSVVPLKNALNAALIGKHREELIQQFQPMLVALEKDDLHRLYTLLQRLEDSEGLEPMRRTFTEYVTNAGREAIKQISGSEDIKAGNLAAESRLFVESLLRVHDLYAKMLRESFDDNPGFSRALDSACKEFVNTNGLCASGQSRAPVLLAHYCDSLLKKGGARKAGGAAAVAASGVGPSGSGGNASEGANDEGDLEALLSQAIVVFRYIKDSDVFQKFYSRFLARRLVNEQSVSIDSEEAMISKLKEISGVEFTSKMSRMFLDMSLSGEMNDAYSQSIDGGFEVPFNFNMKVLHSVSWPLSLPATQPQLPSQVAQVTDSFNRFYQLKHNGRKLDWLWQHSKAEIKMFFPRATGPAAKAGYTFQVTTYQLAILMLFNEESGPGTGYDSPNGPTLTWVQIAGATGLDDDTIEGEMDVLCKARVLSCSTPKPGKGSRFTLNGGF